MAGRTRNSRSNPCEPYEVSEDSPPIRETTSSTTEPEEPLKPANEPISMENILEHLPRDQAIFLQGMLAVRKHPRTESLDMTSRDTREPKRNFLKPRPLKATYRTTTYKSFCEFAFEIDSQARLCDMEDEKAVTYAMTGLYYTEAKNWLDHLGDDCKRSR
ncbi:hypothetical protein ACJ73_08371 [Blastomyces percursus]|uniref:Uncharacterized protein n=1 Tax=Blastomyces percursus TaxID=1658174 RepID=A0A1J9PVG7_9EURO|nr:hypothetical protein ACJ73_08371 [Blastomyces percursus]